MKEWVNTNPAYTTGNPTDADDIMYKVTETRQGEPDKITYYNRMGQERMKEIQGFNNTAIFSITTYNNKGQVVASTEPFFQGASNISLSQTTYDDYNRIASVTSNGETVTYTYEVENGLQKTTTTNPDGTTHIAYEDAAGNLIKSQDNGGLIEYSYFSHGGVNEIKLNSKVVATSEYDAIGRQTKLIDINAGTSTYTYTPFGEMKTSTNANGANRTKEYDEFGRLMQENVDGYIINYEYVAEGNGLNQLKKISTADGMEETYEYDELGRVLTVTENIQGESFTFTYTYNELNQPESITYPSGLVVYNVYDDKGTLIKVTNAQGEIYWEGLEQDAFGRFTSFTKGDGVATTYHFNAFQQLEEIQAGNIQHHTYQWDNQTGNLSERKDLIYGLQETFTYDNLNRLETGVADNPGQAPSQARLDYLQKHEDFNHQFSWRNPGYPIFTRNVSISNGISQSRINGSTSDHYPFPEEEGHTFFKHERFGRRWQAHFVAPGSNTTVFRYDERSWWNWKIVDEAKVSNPWILDNAPRGTSSMSKKQEEKDGNTMFHVVNLLNKTTTFIGGNADVARFRTLYSFTPTVLTHDIRNYNPFDNNGMGRMHFDMKAQGMMYQSEEDTNPNDPIYSRYFGYPHLGRSWDIFALNDHGLIYTPFDAVFSWDDVNTVHLTNREVIFDEERNNGSGGWYEDGDNSFLRTQIRDFLIDESDYFDAYVQNRRFGENANSNHIYKADVIARNEIYVGRKVTQRTDFRTVQIQENTAVRFIACKSVTLKPGIEIKPGASFYAGVSGENCSCGGVLGMSKNDDNTNRLSEEQYLIQEKSLQTEVNDVNLLEVKLYPNPGKDVVNLAIEGATENGFEYKVFSVSGVLVDENIVETNITQLYLKQGMYIVKLKYKGEWHTKKLIMQ